MSFDSIMFNLIFFLVAFLVVFLIDYYILCKKKTKKKRVDKLTSEGDYLIRRFNLDINKINLKMFNFHISIINAFIISFVTTVISTTNLHIIIQLSIGFVLLFALIYSMYEIYGRHIKKKWGKN